MRAGTCKHFNGIQNNTCHAGVRYKQFALGVFPCIKKFNKENVTCDKYAEPSAEEVAAHDAMIKAEMEKFMAAGPLIKEVKREHKGTNWKGVKECPVCKGKLHMSHAAYNGHVWGRCETEGCLAWME